MGGKDASGVKDSVDALQSALEEAWSDPAVSTPPGGLATGNKSDWVHWATRSLTRHCDWTTAFCEEDDADFLEMHEDALRLLSEESPGVPHGRLDHVLALNSILVGTLSGSGWIRRLT